LFGRFDESLARYSQAHAERIAATKKGLDLREVWEKYKIHQSGGRRKQPKRTLETVERCLDKLTPEHCFWSDQN
jgi:hypothetical protein